MRFTKRFLAQVIREETARLLTEQEEQEFEKFVSSAPGTKQDPAQTMEFEPETIIGDPDFLPPWGDEIGPEPDKSDKLKNQAHFIIDQLLSGELPDPDLRRQSWSKLKNVMRHLVRNREDKYSNKSLYDL